MSDLKAGDHCPTCEQDDLTEDEVEAGRCYDCQRYGGSRDWQKAEIERLEGIVEELLKTEDGGNAMYHAQQMLQADRPLFTQILDSPMSYHFNQILSCVNRAAAAAEAGGGG